MMTKRFSAAVMILFVFFFSVACTSTDFKRIHKEVVEVEEKNENAETLPLKSIVEDKREDETLLSLTPLYENGSVVASSEEKSAVDDSAPGREETFTFERVYDIESSDEKAGEIRAVDEKKSLPSFVLALASVCTLLVVIIVLGVVILVRRKKKTNRTYSSSVVQSVVSDDGYISELIEGDDEEKTEEKDEKNTIKAVDIDEIIDIIK